MVSTRLHIKQFNMLKNILQLLNNKETSESLCFNIENYFKDTAIVDILLTEHELISGEYGITVADVEKLSQIHPHLYNDALDEGIVAATSDPSHPVQIIKEENQAFQSMFNVMNLLFESFAQNPQHANELIDEMKQKINRLGQFHNQYNRKEKLFFPVLERYGYIDPSRLMWAKDDKIRSVYKTLKRQISLPTVNMARVQNTFDTFEKKFTQMIFLVEAIILPVMQTIFHEKDWQFIKEESTAFGYALIEPDINTSITAEVKSKGRSVVPINENIPFGGGYLTTEEADLILNNLPLEITFIDKNSLFKYFNNVSEASEMMLVRTPLSIGRNVANCHPPKSLRKVMVLIRDLKTGKRTSESMWFKKGEEYIHITYKALFNEDEEFLGVLEYVQDIQPFFELPSEVKTGLRKLEE